MKINDLIFENLHIIDIHLQKFKDISTFKWENDKEGYQYMAWHIYQLYTYVNFKF